MDPEGSQSATTVIEVGDGDVDNIFEARWQILFQFLLEFISECKSERMIKIVIVVVVAMITTLKLFPVCRSYYHKNAG